MKKFLIGLISVISIFGLLGCEDITQPLTSQNFDFDDDALAKKGHYEPCVAEGEFIGFNEPDNPNYAVYEYTLWADKDENVGTVNITRDDENIYVTYNTAEFAELDKIHVNIWSDPDDIPNKRPKKKSAYYEAKDINNSTYTVVIPADLIYADTYYISAQAKIVYICNDDDDDEDNDEDNDEDDDEDDDENDDENDDEDNDDEDDDDDCNGVNPNDPNSPLTEDYKSYVFNFTNGTTVSGVSEDNFAEEIVDGYHMELHVSCSDDFPNGYGAKGDPTQSEGHPEIASYQIWKYRVDTNHAPIELQSTCGTLYGNGNGDCDCNDDDDNDNDGCHENGHEHHKKQIAYAGDAASPACFDDAGKKWWSYVNYCVDCLASISGTVYEDEDNSGDFGVSEAEFDGITVTASGSDGNIYTTLTELDGSYLFASLPTGLDYTVISAAPEGDFDADENADGYTVIALEDDVIDANFGFSSSVELSECGIISTLWANDITNVGTLSIENSEDNLYITFDTNELGDLEQIHIDISPTYPRVMGDPWNYNANVYAANLSFPADVVTVTIPFSATDFTCSSVMLIKAHAVLGADGTGGTTLMGATAFGGVTHRTKAGPPYYWDTIYSSCCIAAQ